MYLKWGTISAIFHQVSSKPKDWKAKYFSKCLGAIKPKSLNRIAKISYGHLCLKEDNISNSGCEL
jgi:hypothetical protein